MNAVNELEEAYNHYKNDPDFCQELETLFNEYYKTINENITFENRQRTVTEGFQLLRSGGDAQLRHIQVIRTGHVFHVRETHEHVALFLAACHQDAGDVEADGARRGGLNSPAGAVQGIHHGGGGEGGATEGVDILPQGEGQGFADELVRRKLILGHAVADITEGTYTHVKPEELIAEISKIKP
jgi:hypothetical protein